MRNSSLFRSGLTVAAASALPLFAAAVPATAQSGISVSTTGSTVSVTTSACTRSNGSWGTASLLNSRQSNFSQGRRVSLTGTEALQSAAWSDVSAGTFTVIVICSDGTRAGTQAVIVSPTARPTISATTSPSPSRGVMGGMGGGSRDYGTLTMVGGGVLVGAGVGGAVWFLRRRSSRPGHL
ncbi:MULTISPECIES: hypothetical protein [Streptomyces]|jgi:hypothetical protein|uniref:hypothetical protein n=1 Tax=Streptomyces TaxID=1883 RepID=UPI000747F85A|nr:MULTISPECIES: hypothetical protein [Streptomyces]KUL73687.1 hypothetical protein ADL33_19735 [Streptomyces sp. NRRL WC-3604]KUL79766.1 hypothetical protein ADL34_02355 [Streptomyces sp. NRRL WC-3605]